MDMTEHFCLKKNSRDATDSVKYSGIALQIRHLINLIEVVFHRNSDSSTIYPPNKPSAQSGQLAAESHYTHIESSAYGQLQVHYKLLAFSQADELRLLSEKKVKKKVIDHENTIARC